MMNKWVYIVLLIACCQKLISQTNCDNIIENATDLYNSGRYDDCIMMLESGLKTCPLSKNKKENAYILLINSNIEKDSLPGIDKNIRLLLMNNPAFKIKEYSGIDDFTNHFNNYYIYPKFSIGIRPDYSSSRVIIGKVYSVMPNANNENKYSISRNRNVNLIIEYRLIEKISFFADAGAFTLNPKRNLADNYWQLSSNEELKFFQLDIGNKYFLKTPKQLNYYLMGGYSNLFLLSSKLELDQTTIPASFPYEIADTNTVKNYKNDINSKQLRNSYLPALFAGAGVIYKIGYFGIGLDIRTSFSLITINKKTARFSAPDLIQDFSYIDSNTRLLKTDFSLVVTYLFNKTKRKQLTPN